MEFGQSTVPHNCPPGSGWGSERVQPAAKALQLFVEEWKSWKDERWGAAMVENCYGENRFCPLEAHALGCGYSELGCPLLGKGPPLVESGNAADRRKGNQTEGPYDLLHGGGSLDRRVSLE